jgi:hypothetical protein
MGKMINVYTVLTGKPEGKIPCGRTRSRLENSVKISTKEVEISTGAGL